MSEKQTSGLTFISVLNIEIFCSMLPLLLLTISPLLLQIITDPF